VIAYHEVSRGTLDATLVHPREVLCAMTVEAISLLQAG
jgi:DNA repair protein RadC